jgi:hypothetical protein
MIASYDFPHHDFPHAIMESNSRNTDAAVNSQDIGTSRWQLSIKTYINYPRLRKGAGWQQLAHGRRRLWAA